MTAKFSFDALKKAVKAGEIDTVIAALVDMQGRLQGKRFHAQHFVDSGWQETHCCNYLLATDLEMATVQGYEASSWERGYGDYVMKPDMETLRLIPWVPGTALVICDLLDHHTHQPVPHAPRSVLKRQIGRAKEMGYDVMMATELEFFLFEESYPELFDAGYPDPTPVARYNVDYSIFGNSRCEPAMRDMRNALYRAGIPVECSKGEAERGQEELNVKYSGGLETADMHVLVKQCAKEVAQSHGLSATFMAKYHTDKAGSSSHVHQSLWKAGKPVFFDAEAPNGMSELMHQYLGGQLTHAREITYFLAPYTNSYKRFCEGLFAPTKAVWSLDNRTAGFRICGEGTKSIRVECRIGGADLNPYLACAALLAAGLAGIEGEMDPGPEAAGDIYKAGEVTEVPKSLGEALGALEGSAMLKDAFGSEVVAHYARAARWELEEQNRVVTDWERMRGFERA